MRRAYARACVAGGLALTSAGGACAYTVPAVVLGSGDGGVDAPSRPADGGTEASPRSPEASSDGLGPGFDTGPVGEAGSRDGGDDASDADAACIGPIAFKGKSSNTTGSMSALDVPAPANVAVGDFLLAFVTTVGASVPTPTGWTQVANLNNQQNGVEDFLAVFYRVAGSNEPTTYPMPASTTVLGAALWILDYTGVDLAQPIDAQQIGAVAYQAPFAAPAVTTASAGDRIVVSYGYFGENAAALPTPSGTTGQIFVDTGSMVYVGGGSYDEAQASPGSVGPFALGSPTDSYGLGETAALRACP